jgi:hypothetical protein
VVLPPYRTELYVHVILVSVCQDYLQGLPDSLVGARLVFPVQGYLSPAHVSKKKSKLGPSQRQDLSPMKRG